MRPSPRAKQPCSARNLARVNPLDRQIAESESKLVLLLREVKGTPFFDRARLYIAKFSGGRPLSEWIHDDKVPARDRATVARTLVEILLTKQFERLPEVEGETPAPPAPAEIPAARPPAPAATSAPESDEDEVSDLSPAHQELVRKLARSEARKELANILETVVRVLRDTH